MAKRDCKQGIDPKQVQEMAAVGCTNAEIAKILGFIKTTALANNFNKELELGRAEMCMSLRRRQFELAMEGKGQPAVVASIWLGKNYLGQSDRSENWSTVKYADATPEKVEAAIHSIFGKKGGSVKAAGASEGEKTHTTNTHVLHATILPKDTAN